MKKLEQFILNQTIEVPGSPKDNVQILKGLIDDLQELMEHKKASTIHDLIDTYEDEVFESNIKADIADFYRKAEKEL